MNQSEAPIALDELLRHSRWVRAIARRLVHQDADDVVQTVWETAARHPPRHTRSLRGWLARVVVTSARSRARGEARRRRRDAASEVRTESPATPEEAAARMEIHRLLASLILELPEPYQHVVYLRYVDDLDLAEIAVLLDLPPGTVRWRLSEAHARLRGKLDERYRGERRAWVLALAPVAGRVPSKRPLLALTAVSAGVLITALSLIAGRSGVTTTAKPTGGGTRPATALGPGKPPGAPRLAQFAALAADQTCPEVEPLQAVIADIQRAADPWRNVREVFRDAAPNANLERAARPVVDGLFKGSAPGCEHSLSCRGPVCEAIIVTPDGNKPPDCAPKGGPAFWDYLSSGANNQMDSGTPVHDPLKGKSYTATSQLWRFDNDDAAPVPRHRRAPLPDMKFDFGAPLPAVPARMSEDCEKRWRKLTIELDDLRQEIMEAAPQQVFASSAPNDGLVARVTSWARAVLDRPSGALPLAVACRALVCALTPSGDRDPLAIRWECWRFPGEAGETCLPSRPGADWFTALQKRDEPLGRVRAPYRRDGLVTPAFLIVRSDGQRKRSSPWVALLAFADSFDWRDALRSCDSRFGQPGELRMKVEVPRTNFDDGAPGRVSIHLAGSLAGTEVGRCVSTVFEEATGRFVVPPMSDGAVVESYLRFPFDPRTFEATLARLRK